jgi:acyl-CoA synthetase (AMP-forming)/AMP-acid ligase II/1-acyl-sn-glycerol-3-phosphate acyltransferase/acyl carrier protein
MKKTLALVFKLILRLRYTVEFTGDKIDQQFSSTLILPNHPAEIDPVIISAWTWNATEARPVVLETFYKLPLIHQILSMIGAIPMPDMELGSGFYKMKKIEQALKATVSAVDQGDNILIYPSGRLSLDGREVIGGASGLYKIIQEVRDARVLLIRSRGLWGSRFSKALTNGRRPDLIKAILSSLSCILLNLIFFVPKRKVTLTIKEEDVKMLKSLSISELNLYLQSFYDSDSGESFNSVKNHFLGEAQQLIVEQPQENLAEVEIEPDLKNQVITKLAEISQKPSQQLNSATKLFEDLALDSLTIAEFVVWLQDELEVMDVDLAELKNINDIFKVVQASRAGHKQNSGNYDHTPRSWTKSISKKIANINDNDFNLVQALVRSCKQYSKAPALTDPILGVKKYIELLRAALLFRKTVESIPGNRVAVLLPASGTAAIITFAIWLAGKTPVYLNWTAGIRNLEHAVKSLEITRIITAGSVLDKINYDLSCFSDHFVLLEEVKASWKLSDKIRAMLESILPYDLLCSYLGLKYIRPEDAAVILFTSGSEAFPKTVPLSHSNILSNIKDILKSFGLLRSDVFYSFLPPFHSFGLTVTTILPLVTGMRVAFHPNPNESRKIAQGCRTWRITAMAGTPSFLRGVFSSAEAINFANLRLVVSGAERLADDVRELAAAKAANAQILEGYGITECSPVVSVQRPDSDPIGVGEALPGISLKIVDLNTFEELPEGQTGLVLISGESVFPGYLDSDKNPFIKINHQLWYNSGDLGYINQGSLVLAGRLKRFIKIGGEMVSLPAIEEALEKTFNIGELQYQFAVVDSEDPKLNRSSLYLFTNLNSIDIDQVNEVLKKAGFTPLTKIRQVKYTKEMPVLGSGKIDLQVLKQSLL